MHILYHMGLGVKKNPPRGVGGFRLLFPQQSFALGGGEIVSFG